MMSRNMLLGLGLAGAAAYFTSSPSRREQMKDQFVRASDVARKAFDSTRRGITARASSMIGYTQSNWNTTPERMSSR